MTEHTIVRNGKQARVTLGEQLIAADVPAFQSALKQEIGAGVREIVFDMARTVSVDSTGIGLLIAANNSLTSAQGAIRLVNVSSDILKLLRSMRLVDRLHASAVATEGSHG